MMFFSSLLSFLQLWTATQHLIAQCRAIISALYLMTSEDLWLPKNRLWVACLESCRKSACKGVQVSKSAFFITLTLCHKLKTLTLNLLLTLLCVKPNLFFQIFNRVESFCQVLTVVQNSAREIYPNFLSCWQCSGRQGVRGIIIKIELGNDWAPITFHLFFFYLTSRLIKPLTARGVHKDLQPYRKTVCIWSYSCLLNF